jgi:hypothetical protein
MDIVQQEHLESSYRPSLIILHQTLMEPNPHQI